MASTPAPGPGTLPTEDEKAKAGSSVAQWAIGGARYLVSAGSIAASTLAKVGDLVAKAVANADVTLNLNVAADTVGVLPFTYTYKDDSGKLIGTSISDVIKWAGDQAGIPASLTEWANYRSSQGALLSNVINKSGLPAIGAAFSAADRIYRLNNFSYDASTKAQLISSTVADALNIVEFGTTKMPWLLNSGIVLAENAAVKVSSWANNLRGLPSAIDVPSLVEPSTPVGKFISWAGAQAAGPASQAGGVANVMYGTFNLGKGTYTLVTEPDKRTAAALQVTSGAIDLFNGIVQLKRAVNGDAGTVWNRINEFGLGYPPALQIASRLVAAGTSIASAYISSQATVGNG